MGPADLLPDALVTRFTHGYAASVAPLSQAPAPILSAAVGFAERAERCGSRAASRRISGTDEPWHMLATRGVPVARDTGALHVHSGAFTTAAALIGEVDAITQAIGLPPLKYAACMIAATRGDQAQALFDLSWRNATERGEGSALGQFWRLTALRHNGHRRAQPRGGGARVAPARVRGVAPAREPAHGRT